MCKSGIATCVVAALAFAVTAGVQGAAPSGNYTIEVKDHPFLDVNGNLDITLPLSDTDFNMNLSMDGNGKIVGTGHTETKADTFYGTLYLTMDYGLTGKVTATNGIGRMSLKMKITGTAELSGFTEVVPLKGTASMTGDVDLNNRTILVTTKVKVCAKGVGCQGGTDSFTGTLTDQDVADWSLDLSISQVSEKKLSGIATVRLATGPKYAFTVKGAYDPKKDLSTLALKGSTGGSLKLTGIKVNTEAGPTPALTGGSMAVKVCGQKG